MCNLLGRRSHSNLLEDNKLFSEWNILGGLLEKKKISAKKLAKTNEKNCNQGGKKEDCLIKNIIINCKHLGRLNVQLCSLPADYLDDVNP